MLTKLDLIDQISEKHGLLRAQCELLWHKQSTVDISPTEWYILSIIHPCERTISEIAKSVSITRQATHKTIRSLETKGLLQVYTKPDSKKNRYVLLTGFGEECLNQYISIKQKIEEQITCNIGYDNTQALKSILKGSWGFPD